MHPSNYAPDIAQYGNHSWESNWIALMNVSMRSIIFQSKLKGIASLLVIWLWEYPERYNSDANVAAKITSDHYIKPPLFQGGLKVTYFVTVTLRATTSSFELWRNGPNTQHRVKGGDYHGFFSFKKWKLFVTCSLLIDREPNVKMFC